MWSGFRISLQKSTIYMAGVSNNEKRRMLTNFSFEEGDLPSQVFGSSSYDSVYEKARLSAIGVKNQT